MRCNCCCMENRWPDALLFFPDSGCDSEYSAAGLGADCLARHHTRIHSLPHNKKSARFSLSFSLPRFNASVPCCGQFFNSWKQEDQQRRDAVRALAQDVELELGRS